MIELVQSKYYTEAKPVTHLTSSFGKNEQINKSSMKFQAVTIDRKFTVTEGMTTDDRTT